MSTPPKAISLSREDFPAQAEWIDKLLRPLNAFTSSVSAALDRRLTATANMSAALKAVTVAVPDWTPVASSGSTDPYFKNSWTNYSASWDSAACWVDDEGWTCLRGLVKDGSAINTQAFALPTDARPSKHKVLVGVSQDGYGRYLDVNASSGAVTPVTGNTTFWSLDGIRFDRAKPPPAFAGSGWPLVLAHGLSGTVSEVRLVEARDLTANTAAANTVAYAGHGVSWRNTAKTSVAVDRVSGLTPGRRYALTFLVLSE